MLPANSRDLTAVVHLVGIVLYAMLGVMLSGRRRPWHHSPSARRSFAGALVTGPLTGGSFNPAPSLGPAVVGGVWTAHWLCWLEPNLGMILGMRAYEWLRDARASEVPRGIPLGVEGPIDKFASSTAQAEVQRR